MAIKVTHIEPEFVDDRGYISRLVDDDNIKFRAVLYITGKKGAIRGNHYHKNDSHYVYCLSGSFRYYEKNMEDQSSKTESVILKEGDLVLSSPKVAHAMEFLEESVFLAVTTEPRDQELYEKDLVRINITDEADK